MWVCVCVCLCVDDSLKHQANGPKLAIVIEQSILFIRFVRNVWMEHILATSISTDEEDDDKNEQEKPLTY